MKIVYLANVRFPTEKAHGYQIVKMCEAFAQNGAEVHLVHPYRRQDDPELRGKSLFDYYSVPQVFTVCTSANFDVVRLSRLLPKRAFTAFYFAHAMLWGLFATLRAREEAAEIYYTRDSMVAYWLGRMGLPTIYEGHEVPRRAQRSLLRRVAGMEALQLAVVVTSFIGERFVQLGFQPDKVIVQPDAADLALFDRVPGKEECRKRLGLPLTRTIIGYVGRFRALDREKGIPELVQAMPHVLTVPGSDPLLLGVGGPMEAVPAYRAIARRCGVADHHLQFVDRVPNREVPFWIRACDVVTIPWPWTEFSAYFTSPMKLFEYIAAGVPIVASDLPSVREILRHGENAWLVPAGDPYLLAQGLVHVLTNRELARNLAGRAQVDARHYTWRGRAGQILSRVGS